MQGTHIVQKIDTKRYGCHKKNLLILIDNSVVQHCFDITKQDMLEL